MTTALLSASEALDDSAVLDLIASLRPAWHKDAACRATSDYVTFHQEEGKNDDLLAAKALCARCPVWNQCYQAHVIEKAETYGVWAGFTRDGAIKERKRLGIKLQKGPCNLPGQPHD